jgi:hypothetical protein
MYVDILYDLDLLEILRRKNQVPSLDVPAEEDTLATVIMMRHWNLLDLPWMRLPTKR